jgi:hypothetical protein
MKPCLRYSVIAAALGLTMPVLASTGRYPGFGIDYSTAIQYDFSRLDVPRQPRTITTNGYLDIATDAHFRLNPADEIWLSMELSPVTDTRPSERRWLGGTGLNVNDLNWYHQGYDESFRIGKFDVPFGRAQNVAPGLYTPDFVSPYALGGMIGGTYERRFSSYRFGTIAASASVYFADTSVLSKPYFRPSDQARRSDGGATNTGKPNNVAAVVNWRAPESLPYLEVQLGFMANQKGDTSAANPTASNEQLRVASVRYMIPFVGTTQLSPTLAGRYLDLVPFVEYVKVSNENGVPGFDTAYLTTSLTFDAGRFAYGVTHTNKRLRPRGGPNTNEYITEGSVVYHATGLIDLAFSAGKARQGGQTSGLLGFSVTLNGAF